MIDIRIGSQARLQRIDSGKESLRHIARANSTRAKGSRERLQP
jgi:hypothetical protein